MTSGRDRMMDRWDLEKPQNIEEQKDSALEHYMRKCSELEHEVAKLKERIKRLEWSIEEHD